MNVKLPFRRLVCPHCAAEAEHRPRGMSPDGMFAEVRFQAEGGRPARSVAIDVLRLKVEDRGEGLTHGHVTARVPCIGGDHTHDIDISDVYRAPQLHLEGSVRCSRGHPMTLDKVTSWEYLDDGEYGGTILVSGLLSCVACGGPAIAETVRLAAPDMASAAAGGDMRLNLEAALPGRRPDQP
ncbi:hypothetical protein K9U40_03920 [Xanthobacter autotrophicus]|uniref:hypothetical protein n=1 Tax=Xanthobacter TaxID=279 RepID=UPI0024AC2D2E|nr:hypothetical protein [Xanthobacter autotrophicus]MDI4663486.1 hypothetical protein [Xanthobacter autotrophicus]